MGTNHLKKILKSLYFKGAFWATFSSFAILMTCRCQRSCSPSYLLIANRSGCSPKMSNHEQFAQVTHQNWATVSKSLRSLTKNERIIRFFERIAHSLIFSQKTSDLLRKPMSEFPTLAPFKQEKSFSPKFSFLRRFSIAKLENCVST